MSKERLSQMAFEWSDKTIRTLVDSINSLPSKPKAQDIKDVLNKVMEAQEIGAFLDTLEKHIETLTQLNEHKWNIMNSLLRGDAESAASLVDKSVDLTNKHVLELIATQLELVDQALTPVDIAKMLRQMKETAESLANMDDMPKNRGH